MEASIKLKRAIRIVVVGLLAMILIFILFLLNREAIVVYLSHLQHNNELAFVKEFLKELKTTEIEKMGRFFWDPRIERTSSMKPSAQAIWSWIEESYDKELRKRDYAIKTIRDDRDQEGCDVSLATKYRGKSELWLRFSVVQKEGRYYIDRITYMTESLSDPYTITPRDDL